uniref:Rho-GAP domain-containing protein n=1 Tax=Plectus sambesii TaxID=2011161 RepID=A0A914VS33_9BILA
MCSQFSRGTLTIAVGAPSSSSSSMEPAGRRQSDLTGVRPKDSASRFASSETGSVGRLAPFGEFAPLATPEHIEVGMEYMTVKDAIGGYSDDEQQYATLDSINRATTSGEASIDTRHSSLEGRRACANERSSSPSEAGAPRQAYPSTRPKAVSGSRATGDGVGIADRLRRLNQDLLLTVPGADATRVEARGRNTALVTSVSTGALMMRSASDESIVERTPTTADGEQRKPKSKGQFVRRVTSSFRFRKNRRLTPTTTTGDADWSEPESVGSKSVPQSPLMERQQFAPLPVHQRGVFVLPPVAPATFDDPVIDSARQTSPQQSSFSWLPTRSPKRDRSVPVNGGEKKTVLGGLRRASADQSKSKKSGSSGPGTPSSGVVPHGATLFDLAANPNDPVPLFVRKCVEFIESEGGLELEGLYRVPGNQSQVAQLEQKFVENHALDFRTLDLPVNAVATA